MSVLSRVAAGACLDCLQCMGHVGARQAESGVSRKDMDTAAILVLSRVG